MQIKENIRNIFKDHKAQYRDLGEIQVLDWKRDDTFCNSVRYVFDRNNLYISGDYGCSVYHLTWIGTPESFKDINLGYFYEKNEAHQGDKYSFNRDQAKENIKDYFESIFEEFINEISDIEETINELECDLDDLNDDLDDLNDEDEFFEDDFFEDETYEILKEIEGLEIRIKEMREGSVYQKRRKLLNNLLDLASNMSSNDEWVHELGCSSLFEELKEIDYDCWEWIYGVGEDIPFRAEIHLAGLILANEYLENNK